MLVNWVSSAGLAITRSGRLQPTTLSQDRQRRLRLRSLPASEMQLMSSIVTPEWLKERLDQPGLKVLDASWYLPSMGKDAKAEYKARRVPGAAFFDIDGICLPESTLPHMLPTALQFAAAMDALDVQLSDTVVIYDGLGMFSAPRVWWTFRVFGHERVAVMEGGLPSWCSKCLPLDETAASDDALTIGKQAAQAAGEVMPRYSGHLQLELVRSLAQMRALVDGQCKAEQVVDARPAGRFAGIDPEPRAGMRGGHMPGARNVPITQVYEDGIMQGARLKSPEELMATFEAAGVYPREPVVCSCGSGLTACVLALALYQINGGRVVPVYDGSWTEWGSLPDTPIVKSS